MIDFSSWFLEHLFSLASIKVVPRVQDIRRLIGY